MDCKYLHLISFDIPYPADYGGVIDVYFKVKALHDSGVKVILHCFEYGRARAPHLETICEAVHYYKRYIFKNPFNGEIPYIVSTRSHQELLDRLCLDNHPILFEGLHTTYFLDHERLRQRKKFIRTHNVEHDYYSRLETTASNYIKKLFFRKEAERLKAYELRITKADGIFAISQKDCRHFEAIHSKVSYLPAFHPNDSVGPVAPETAEKFVLYHGNLSVGENDEAAKFLVREVWKQDFDMPLVIAGNGASSELTSLCRKNPQITLVSPTSAGYIDMLIRQATINLLITFQDTGIKLKLLNALFKGKHCLVNDAMIHSTGLESLCVTVQPDGMREPISKWFSMPYTEEQAAIRKEILEYGFCNQSNIQILIDQI